MKSWSTSKLILTGILSALVFVVTSFTMIRIPIIVVKDAYFHAGDSIILLSGLLLGSPVAAIVSGIGSLFADLYLGSQQYMFATLIIKGIMGGIAGYFLHRPKTHRLHAGTFLGLVAAGLWMALGYYLYEVLFLGINWIANLTNLAANLIQAAVGIIIYLPLSKALRKTPLYSKYIR